MVNCLCLRSCEIHVELLPRAPPRPAHPHELCMFAICRAICMCAARTAHTPHLPPRPGAGPTAHAGPQGAQASAAPWETWWLSARDPDEPTIVVCATVLGRKAV